MRRRCGSAGVRAFAAACVSLLLAGCTTQSAELRAIASAATKDPVSDAQLRAYVRVHGIMLRLETVFLAHCPPPLQGYAMNVVTRDSATTSVRKGIPLAARAESEAPTVPDGWGEKAATADDAIAWPLLGPAYRGFSASAKGPSTGSSDADGSLLLPACLYALSISDTRGSVASGNDGQLFFNRALFDTPEIEPALPFIVAHEAAHLLLRHDHKIRENFQNGRVFLSVSLTNIFGSLIDFTLAPLGITAVGAWRDATVARALHLDRYEAEADALGYCLARAAGFDLAGLAPAMRALGNLVPRLATGDGAHAGIDVRMAALPRTEEACDTAMAHLADREAR